MKKGIMYVFCANLINLLISLITGFVLPKMLSIDTYANIKLFQLYITYIGILHLGFADGMYLRLGGKNHTEINKEEVGNELKTFKFFQYIICAIAIVISIFLRNEIILFCSLVIIPINMSSYLRNLYQAIGEFRKYSRFTNINTILIFLINMFLLFIIKTDQYQAYIIGYIIVYFVYYMIIEIEIKHFLDNSKEKFDMQYLINDVKDGFLLMIGNFCNVIFTGIDRLFVKNCFGNTQFAYYSFAVSIENLVNVFITPISTVMYNYLCKNREKKDVLKIKNIIVLFSSFLISCAFPVKFIVNRWINKYDNSIDILFLLLSAQYLSIVVKCVHINLYKAEKKQKKYFLTMIFVIILSVILNVIGYYTTQSMLGIAIATLTVNLIWFLIGEIDFKKYCYHFKEYIFMVLILISFFLCNYIRNTILGFLVYIFIIFNLSIIFMRETIKYIFIEVKKYLTKRRMMFKNK